MREAKALHVYTCGDKDWIVAESREQAKAMAIEYGHHASDLEDDDAPHLLDDASTFKMWCDVDGKVCEVGDNAGKLVEQTAAEWARTQGPGFLGSTNF